MEHATGGIFETTSLLTPQDSPPAALCEPNDPLIALASEAAAPEAAAPDATPVTILVARRIKPDQEKEFESALAELQQILESQQGFTELKAYQPGTPEDEHKVVVSFENATHLARWQESPERKAWLLRVKPLEMEPPRAQIHTGLESWFALPEQEGLAPPPRYKMGLVTWLAIFPTITLVNYFLAPHLESLPIWLSSGLISALLVTLMTNWIMPFMTRRTAKFLYPEIELPARGK